MVVEAKVLEYARHSIGFRSATTGSSMFLKSKRAVIHPPRIARALGATQVGL